MSLTAAAADWACTCTTIFIYYSIVPWKWSDEESKKIDTTHRFIEHAGLPVLVLPLGTVDKAVA